MVHELKMLKEKGVFEVVPRPQGKNIIGSKWVYALKWKENGMVERRKARTVAKGFTQVIGEDYNASVARLESVRLVCAIAASRGLRLWQVNFVSAFLNSDNAYEMYMEQPKGFEEGGADFMWKLRKTLYGTMQGAHDWAENLNKTFKGHGYYKSSADPQIRSKVVDDKLTITSTWTDDILGASSTLEGELSAKAQLGSSYEIKDLGEAKLILGMQITRNASGDITLSQQAYCERMIERFNMGGCAPASTPLPPGLILSHDDCPTNTPNTNEMKDVPYCEALGSLMWLQVATRPDLSYAVNILSRFAHNPGKPHWNALKHTLAYIKGTTHYGVTFQAGGNLDPIGYVDSNFAGCRESRQSTEGNIFIVAGGPVSWESKRQETVVLSTVKAEYMAFTRATSQAIWLSKFFDEVGLQINRPVLIYGDNAGSIANTVNDKNHRRTKHIDVKYYFVKEHAKSGQVKFEYTPSTENIADLFTKPLPRDAVQKLIT